MISWDNARWGINLLIGRNRVESCLSVRHSQKVRLRMRRLRGANDADEEGTE